MSRPRAIGRESWALAGLTLAVLAAHLALIASSPAWMGAGAPPPPAAPLQTRWITLAPEPAPVAPATAPRPVRAAAADSVATPPARPRPTAATPRTPDTPMTAAHVPDPRPADEAVEPPADTRAATPPGPAASVAAAAPPEAAPQGVAAASPASTGPSGPGSPAAGAAEPALPVRIPPPARLVYDVEGEARRLRYHAQAELSWQHDGDRYEARLTVGAFLVGSRTQTSSGRIGPQGLMPTRFSDKSRNELAAHFDRERGRIVFSANTPEAALLPGAQDRLSVFVQLAALRAAEPDPGQRRPAHTLQTAGSREAELWQFRLDGEESVAVEGQPLAAVKLTRHPRREHDVRVELWLAPALGYLPARIRITQSSGDRIDQVLRALPPATPGR